MWFILLLILFICILTVVEIGLRKTQYFTNETNGTLEVCAKLKNGTLECNVTVLLSTSNGSAIGL